MTSTSSHTAVGLSFGKYLDRLYRLETSLREHPNQFDAWRRHIQLKVMKFVVSRYADGALIDLSRLDELHRLEPRPSAQSYFHGCSGRTLADLLPILQRISDVNRR